MMNEKLLGAGLSVGVVLLVLVACARAAPTPTPTPIRAQQIRVLENRQLATEGYVMGSGLLWASEDAGEFILARSLSVAEDLRHIHCPVAYCGEEKWFAQGARVWRIKADGSREFLAESLAEPSVSPDGRFLVYTSDVGCGDDSQFVFSLNVLDLDTMESRFLVEAAAWPPIIPSWLPKEPSTLLVVKGDGLWSIDTATGEGERLNDLELDSSPRLLAFPSPDGEKLLLTEPAQGEGKYGLWLMDMDGENRVEIVEESTAYSVSWAPDSSRFAYMQSDEKELHIVGLQNGTVTDSPFDLASLLLGGSCAPAAWSPDAEALAIQCRGEEEGVSRSSSIYAINADGSDFTNLVEIDGSIASVEWNRGATALSYVVIDSAFNFDLWALLLDEGAATRLPAEPVSLYVRSMPEEVAPNRYVYLEAEDASDELRLEASPVALAAEGMTLVHTAQELERAVTEDTEWIVLNREGARDVDPDWLHGQYEAGKHIFGVWMTGDELKSVMGLYPETTLFPLRLEGDWIHSYMCGDEGGTGQGRGTLHGDRLGLYQLVREMESELIDLLEVRACPGGPVPAPTLAPTPTSTPTPRPPSAGIHTPEDLRQAIDGWPEDYKLVVNEDVAVLFYDRTGGGPFITFPAVIHHVPSMSLVYLGLDGQLIAPPWSGSAKDYKSEEGAAALEAVLADEALMGHIRARIEEGW